MRKTSLSQTFTLSITLFTLCVVGAVAWFSYQQGESVLIGELQRHGVSLAENLAYNSEYGLLFDDVEGSKKLVDGVVQDEDVLYAVILTAEGGIIAEKGLYQYAKLERIVQKRFPEFLKWVEEHPPTPPRRGILTPDPAQEGKQPPTPFDSAQDRPLKGEEHPPTPLKGGVHMTRIYDPESDDDIYDIFAPVFFTPTIPETSDALEKIKGMLSLGSGTTSERELLGVVVVGISFDRATLLLKQIQRQIVGLAVFIVVLAIIIARFLVKTVSQPIEKLARGTRRIARGELTQEVQINRPDEIGELAHSFNFMMHELRFSRQELELWARTLEQRVQERTYEIQEKNQRLTELIQDMKRIQEQLVHSAKMASLGQFVAGIAHEINNPVNFIVPNITPLKNYIADIKHLMSHYDTIQDLPPEKQAEIESIKHNIDFDFLIDDLDNLIKDIEAGAGRIKHIVEDLRNFSRLDEAALKTINLHESLDTTLNLLGHLYENRITVHKHYGTVPPVECYAGQLNQVFMNLLANAAQAIDRRGNVWITTSVQNSERGQEVHISIRDDGRGIPEDIIPKIFDPFFTTKDVGEGTGLGLSISYGIIEKHYGELTVTSAVGEGTEFVITIPQKLSSKLQRGVSSNE
jgi:signal transduction histidine kinase